MKIRVNSKEYDVASGPATTLLDVLRYELGLTGTKEGCSTGSCGSCTVLIDNAAVNSCLVIAAEVEGKDIVTIEGLAQEGKLHPLQQAFIDAGGVQCGFCTPGIILAAKAFLDSNPHPTELEIRQGISGNLCRCTGYDKIVRAIMNVSRSQRG